MQINPENNTNYNFDNRKNTLFKYFKSPKANIIKINSTLNYENFFLIHNENLSENIALLKLNTSNKSSAYADFEIFEIKQINFEKSFPSRNSETEAKTFKILGAFKVFKLPASVFKESLTGQAYDGQYFSLHVPEHLCEKLGVNLEWVLSL